MSGLRLEFYKSRRRKIGLVCLGIIAAQLFWLSVSLSRMEAEELRQGWLALIYNLTLTDAVILPIGVAVLVSRSCESEHRGHTFKMLETMTTPGKIYTNKLCWAALVMAGLLLLRMALFVGIGYAMAFHGGIPWAAWARFTLNSWCVSMMVVALQQGLSLRFANQAVPLIVGLAGSFLGLLGLFFPPLVQRLLPWSYYGLLALVRMNWDQATRVVSYEWMTPQPSDILFLVCWAALFFIVGRTLFVRKEH